MNVFVAFYPRKDGGYPRYLNALVESEHTLIHPSYDFNTERGRDLMEKLSKEPEFKWPRKDLAKDFYESERVKDFELVKVSDVLLYDLDFEPGWHFLAVAALHNIPVLSVSETLKASPPYFSGYIQKTIKPLDVVKHLSIYKTEPEVKKVS